jgi:hypothetical protein
MSRVLLLCWVLGILMACGQPPPIQTDFDQPTAIQGKVVDFVSAGGARTIAILDKADKIATSAPLRSDDTFTLNLPSALFVTNNLESFSGSFLSADCPGTITFNPATQLYFLVTVKLLQVNNANQTINTNLLVGTGGVVNNKFTHQAIVYVFAAQNTQFVGEKRCSDLTIRLSMYLKKGWNTVKYTYSQDSLFSLESVQPQADSWSSTTFSSQALGYLL